MGLNIVSMDVMDGLATLTGLYGHVREIKINKNNNNEYIVECLFHIYKSVSGKNKEIETLYIKKSYNEDFLTKTWEDVYTVVKEHLDSHGIQYTDSI